MITGRFSRSATSNEASQEEERRKQAEEQAQQTAQQASAEQQKQQQVLNNLSKRFARTPIKDMPKQGQQVTINGKTYTYMTEDRSYQAEQKRAQEAAEAAKKIQTANYNYEKSGGIISRTGNSNVQNVPYDISDSVNSIFSQASGYGAGNYISKYSGNTSFSSEAEAQGAIESYLFSINSGLEQYYDSQPVSILDSLGRSQNVSKSQYEQMAKAQKTASEYDNYSILPEEVANSNADWWINSKGLYEWIPVTQGDIAELAKENKQRKQLGQSAKTTLTAGAVWSDSFTQEWYSTGGGNRGTGESGVKLLNSSGKIKQTYDYSTINLAPEGSGDKKIQQIKESAKTITGEVKIIKPTTTNPVTLETTKETKQNTPAWLTPSALNLDELLTKEATENTFQGLTSLETPSTKNPQSALSAGWNIGTGQQADVSKFTAPKNEISKASQSLLTKGATFSQKYDKLQEAAFGKLGTVGDLLTGVTNVPQMLAETAYTLPSGIEIIARNPTTSKDSILLGLGITGGALYQKAKSNPAEFTGELIGMAVTGKVSSKITSKTASKPITTPGIIKTTPIKSEPVIITRSKPVTLREFIADETATTGVFMERAVRKANRSSEEMGSADMVNSLSEFYDIQRKQPSTSSLQKADLTNNEVQILSKVSSGKMQKDIAADILRDLGRSDNDVNILLSSDRVFESITKKQASAPVSTKVDKVTPAGLQKADLTNNEVQILSKVSSGKMQKDIAADILRDLGRSDNDVNILLSSDRVFESITKKQAYEPLSTKVDKATAAANRGREILDRSKTKSGGSIETRSGDQVLLLKSPETMLKEAVRIEKVEKVELVLKSSDKIKPIRYNSGLLSVAPAIIATSAVPGLAKTPLKDLIKHDQMQAYTTKPTLKDLIKRNQERVYTAEDTDNQTRKQRTNKSALRFTPLSPFANWKTKPVIDQIYKSSTSVISVTPVSPGTKPDTKPDVTPINKINQFTAPVAFQTPKPSTTQKTKPVIDQAYKPMQSMQIPMQISGKSKKATIDTNQLQARNRRFRMDSFRTGESVKHHYVKDPFSFILGKKNKRR